MCIRDRDLGVQIYEQSPVVDLVEKSGCIEVKTDKSAVISQDVILATNAYIDALPVSYTHLAVFNIKA